MLSLLPLNSHFEIISGLDYNILRVLVPQVIHFGGVDFDNCIASFKTSSFRWGTAIDLQSEQTCCREKSELRNELCNSNAFNRSRVIEFAVILFDHSTIFIIY